MSNVKTINLTGGETEIIFGQKFKCFWIQNLGSNDVYASTEPGITPETDGVIAIPSGNTAAVSKSNFKIFDGVYVSGDSKVQIVGTASMDCPFEEAMKGGDSGGGICLLTNEDIHDMLDIAKENYKADKILSESLWRKTYDDGLVTNSANTNDYVDTEIKQSEFIDKELTIIIKAKPSTWINGGALFGYYASYDGRYNAQGMTFTALSADDNVDFLGTYHRMLKMDKQAFVDTVNTTSVYIFSDSKEDMYYLINGKEGSYSEIIDLPLTPIDTLKFLRSVDTNFSNGNRGFDGTTYDMIVFDRFLSREEAIAITKRLMDRGESNGKYLVNEEQLQLLLNELEKDIFSNKDDLQDQIDELRSEIHQLNGETSLASQNVEQISNTNGIFKMG